MIDIKFHKKNDSEIIIETSNSIILDNLKKYFSARIKNYQFMPKFKNTGWDGRIYFIKSNSMPIGLLQDALKYLKSNNYEYSLDFPIQFDIPSDLKSFIKSLNLPYQLYDYQIETIEQIFKNHILNIDLPTGSGKTLIVYLLVRYLLEKSKTDKTLVIVPRITLLEQQYSDWKSYGFNDISKYVFCKYSGTDFDDTKPIYISTWQSVYTLIKDHKDFFTQFKHLIIDEAHTVTGQELQNICKACNKSTMKIGFSGTFAKFGEVEYFSQTASLGPIFNFTNYKKLQELNQIPLFKVKIIKIKYNNDVIKKFYEFVGKDFFREQEFIRDLEERNNLLLNMANQFKKNSIFLFQLKEKHGKKLYSLFKDQIKDKILFYIDGDTNIKDIINAKGILENNNNVIGLATFGIFSTGTSINNIHNIILASNYKSRVVILQAIGRSLRRHKTKNMSLIFDVVDDFSSPIYQNYSLKHLKERIKVYQDKKIPYEILEVEV